RTKYCKRALLFSILVISSIYINPVLMRLENTPILIFPILCIFGIFLCMAPTIFNPEFFARDIKYWYLFILTLIVCVLFSTIYNVIVVKTIEYVLGSFIYLIFYFLECFFLIRWIKREKSQDSQTNIGIRGVFTKPEKMTEEEVSISKEKKICLVCKNKVARFNIYICPECDTLYCENCARTLSNLENLCWVCDTPFDESKPVKFFKKVKEMEEIEISEKPQNKLNNAKKL
ncbi:MAG: B-box zinc finger protein, partial [Promethearchaeota archaeon]